MAARVAVVTGANQGIGFALVENLCRTLRPDDVVYLTARNAERGAAAVEDLRARGLAPRFGLLDVGEPSSIAAFAETIARDHGGLDLVIANGARRIDPDVPAAQQVRDLVRTDNLGTTQLIEQLGPLLRERARFLVVASSLGRFRYLAGPLRARFDEAPSMRALDEVMLAYADSVERGTAEAEGWPGWLNIPTKIGRVAAARVFARQVAGRRGIVIDAVCPGLVDTAASRPWFKDMSSAATPEASAVDVIWLATADDVSYGELVQRRKVLAWHAEQEAAIDLPNIRS